MTYIPSRADARRRYHLVRAQREASAGNASFAAANALAYGRPGREYAALAVHSQGRKKETLSIIDAALLDGLQHAQKALGHMARAARLAHDDGKLRQRGLTASPLHKARVADEAFTGRLRHPNRATRHRWSFLYDKSYIDGQHIAEYGPRIADGFRTREPDGLQH